MAPPEKKAKIDVTPEPSIEQTTLARSNLASFELEQVLANDPNTKRVVLLGRFRNEEGRVLLSLEQQGFKEEELQNLIAGNLTLEELISNDIYRLYRGEVPSKFSPLKVNMSFPAKERDIAKARSQKAIKIMESPETYRNVVLPYIKSIDPSRIQWVLNLLDKKSESERILVEDPDKTNGFVLVPDFKWDEKDTSTLYVLAICHRRNILSLRDLTTEHLPMLRGMLEKSYACIEQRFGVSRDEIRAFVHYHPSFYHFHVHFAHASLCHHGMSAGKAHLLEDVIDNIENISESYYRDRSLVFFLPERHDLLQRLREGSA